MQILIGLLIGIPVSIGCARLIAAQLYHVKGWDPLVLAGASSRWDLRVLRQHHSGAKGGVRQSGAGTAYGMTESWPAVPLNAPRIAAASTRRGIRNVAAVSDSCSEIAISQVIGAGVPVVGCLLLQAESNQVSRSGLPRVDGPPLYRLFTRSWTEAPY